MANNVNLDLDLDETGLRGSGNFIARISVQSAHGFTRDGVGPTITTDCVSYRALELEVDRLKTELDDALQRAAAQFEVTRQDRATAAKGPDTAADTQRGEQAHLEVDLAVGAVMTAEVRTLNENDKLLMADELMKQGRFRHVVVLDDDSNVVGVISHRDIFYSAITWTAGLGRFAHRKALESLPVKQVMNQAVQTVSPNTALAEAAAVMAERKIGCLPVMEGEKLVGILTEGDFLALIV